MKDKTLNEIATLRQSIKAMNIKCDVLVENINKLPEDDLSIEGKRRYEISLYLSKKDLSFMSVNLDALWELLTSSSPTEKPNP